MYKFAKYLNVMTLCPANNLNGQCADLNYSVKKSEDVQYALKYRSRIVLADGVLLGVEQRPCEGWRNLDEDGNKTEDSFYETGCGVVIVDLNGSAPPNKWGKDFFYVVVQRTGTKPYHLDWNNYSLKDYLLNER